jgi:hypothetical protein
MAGRRFLTLTGFAAALLLISTGGAAGADPGYGHPSGHLKHHGNGTVHGQRDDHAHGSGSGSGTDDSLDPAVRSSDPTTERDGRVTVRHQDGAQHKSHHWTRRELADHPGKALGLLKHSDTRRDGSDPALQGRPSSPPASPTPVNHPRPAHVPSGHNSPAPSDPSDNDPAGTPGSRPPPAQPPGGNQEQSLSRLLPRVAQLQFTALPLLIAVGLALCIGCLIRLARHRA